MSKFTVKVEHKPIVGPEQVIAQEVMWHMLSKLPVAWERIKLDDHTFYAPAWDSWRRIIEFLQPKVPSYIPERRDCEFMACWFYVHVAEDFQVNTMARVQGWIKTGEGKERHAWNVFTEGQLFYQLEPQTGVIMDIDDPTYVPDEIVMG